MKVLSGGKSTNRWKFEFCLESDDLMVWKVFRMKVLNGGITILIGGNWTFPQNRSMWFGKYFGGKC